MTFNTISTEPAHQTQPALRGSTALLNHASNGRRDMAHRRSMGPLRGSPALLVSLGLALLIAGCGGNQGAPDTAGEGGGRKPAQKIVTLGGNVTETVYALGAGDRIVGTDISSTYPEQARTLPQVGYQRTIAAEQVLSLNPTIVLATRDAGPPTAIEQLKSAGVSVDVVHGDHSVEGARQRIAEIARIVDAEAAGRTLIDTLDNDLANMPRVDSAHRPRVIYVHARGGNGLQVSGTGTAADAVIGIAGGINAVASFPNYKPLTPEAALGAAPDVILVSREGFEQLGGAAAIASMPGISQTPAGRSRRIIPVDDLYLLGFGPRLGKACAKLAAVFNGASTSVAPDESPAAAKPAANGGGR